MSEDRTVPTPFNLRQLFPWLDILRATNLALNPGKVLLGGFGAFLLALGWWAIGYFYVPADANSVNHVVVQETRKFPWDPSVISPTQRYRSVVQSGDIASTVAFSSADAVFEPICRYVHPFRLIFSRSSL